MKRIFTLLVAFLLLSTCQAAKKKRLELNLTKGKTYTQRWTITTMINQPIQGKVVTIGSVIDTKLSFKVIRVQKSVYTLVARYESLSVKELYSNNIVEFDSWKNDNISKTLASLLKEPFQVIITKTGKVVETNLNNLFTNLFVNSPELSNLKKLNIRNLMIKSFGEKPFTKSFNQISSFYPGHKVSTGSKWTSKKRTKLLHWTVITKTTYTLNKTGDSYYYISGNMEIKSGKGNLSNGLYTLPIKMNLTGKTNYNIKMDKKSGWVTDETIHQYLKDVSYIKPKSKTSKWKTIPITINIQARITE